VTASLRICGRIIWTKHQSRIVFRKYPFQNWAIDNVICSARSPIL